MVEACCRAPELKIAIDLPVDTRIHKLSSGFHEAKEATRIQLALNLQIAKLKFNHTPLHYRRSQSSGDASFNPSEKQ